MSEQQAARPTEPAPGSAEDIQIALEVLSGFFTEKLKAAQLYHKTGRLPEGTAGTMSACHVDGTTDPDR